MSSNQVDEFMKEEVEVVIILDSMKAEIKFLFDELLVVCKFPEVFPYDISDLSLGREVEFAIDIVIGTGPVWMAPYRMSASS